MRFLANILAKAGLVVDGAVTLNNVAAASTNTDRFLVVDSGVVKYRTGSQLLSDISAVGGSGTINYVSKFTGATTLGNSQVFDDGTSVGINTNTPSVKFEVAGGSRVSGTIQSQTYTSGLGTSTTGLISSLVQSSQYSATSSQTILGVVSSPNVTASSGFTSVLGGSFDPIADRTSTSATLTITGVRGTAYRNSSTTPSGTMSSTLTGVQGLTGHWTSQASGANTLGAIGVWGNVTSQKSTITNGYGIFSQIQLSTDASAVSPTVNNYYGVYTTGILGRSDGTTIGTLTNYYDAYLAGATVNSGIFVTKRWGVYQANVSHPNYFAAIVQIGSNTSTGETLQVTGTQRVTQDAYFATASGSVGIGTTSPAALLHVYPSTNDMQQMWGQKATGVFSYMRLHRNTSDGTFTFGTAQDGFSSIAFATSNGSNEAFTERMRITTGGDVSIGNTTADPFGRNDERRISMDSTAISATANLALSLNAGATAGRGAQIYMGVGGTRTFTLSSNSTETTLGTATNSPLRLNTNDTTKVYITATGDVGIGTTTPTHLLEVNGTIKFGTRIYFETSAGGFFGSRDEAIGIWMNQAGGNIMQFVTGSNERMRIGASGELLLGSTSSRTANKGYSSGGSVGGAVTPLVQIHANAGGSGGSGRFILHNYVNNDIYGPTYVLLKSRGTAIGSNTIVNSGDNIGTLSFQAVDGAQAMEAAYIAANVDGTSALNSIPGRIIFGTTPVGSTAPVERMRIDSTGSVGIGTSAPSASSILELNSTTRGFLPPKMTAAQRAAISSPAVGLVVYQTDSTEGLWIYTSANGWKALAIVT